jgi:hypothetical protein
VYIGRPSIFGNPVVKGQTCKICGQFHATAGSTLPCYVAYFESRITKDMEFRRAVLALHGKTLVCWCKPAPCHGDIMAEWIDAQYGEP